MAFQSKYSNQYGSRYESGGFKSKYDERYQVEQPEPTKVKRSTLNEVFDLLSIGQYASAGLVGGTLEGGIGEGLKRAGRGIAQGASILPGWEGFEDPADYSFTDVLDEQGWDPETKSGRFARGAVGFVGDVALDPLTYVGIGALGKVLQGSQKAGKIGARISSELLEKTSRELSEKGMKAAAENFSVMAGKGRIGSLTREAAEQIVQSAGTPLSKEAASKEVDNLIKYFDQLGGVKDKTRNLDVSLKYAPFAEKIFGKEIANKSLTVISDEALRKFGDKTIAPIANDIIESFYGTTLGKAFSTKTGMRRLAATNPEGVYKTMKLMKSLSAAGFDKAGKVRAFEDFAKINELGTLTAKERKEVIKAMESPTMMKYVNAQTGDTFSTHDEAIEDFVKNYADRGDVAGEVKTAVTDIRTKSQQALDQLDELFEEIRDDDVIKAFDETNGFEEGPLVKVADDAVEVVDDAMQPSKTLSQQAGQQRREALGDMTEKVAERDAEKAFQAQKKRVVEYLSRRFPDKVDEYMSDWDFRELLKIKESNGSKAVIAEIKKKPLRYSGFDRLVNQAGSAKAKALGYKGGISELRNASFNKLKGMLEEAKAVTVLDTDMAELNALDNITNEFELRDALIKAGVYTEDELKAAVQPMKDALREVGVYKNQLKMNHAQDWLKGQRGGLIGELDSEYLRSTAESSKLLTEDQIKQLDAIRDDADAIAEGFKAPLGRVRKPDDAVDESAKLIEDLSAKRDALEAENARLLGDKAKIDGRTKNGKKYNANRNRIKDIDNQLKAETSKVADGGYAGILNEEGGVGRVSESKKGVKKKLTKEEMLKSFNNERIVRTIAPTNQVQEELALGAMEAVDNSIDDIRRSINRAEIRAKEAADDALAGDVIKGVDEAKGFEEGPTIKPEGEEVKIVEPKVETNYDVEALLNQADEAYDELIESTKSIDVSDAIDSSTDMSNVDVLDGQFTKLTSSDFRRMAKSVIREQDIAGISAKSNKAAWALRNEMIRMGVEGVEAGVLDANAFRIMSQIYFPRKLTKYGAKHFNLKANDDKKLTTFVTDMFGLKQSKGADFAKKRTADIESLVDFNDANARAGYEIFSEDVMSVYLARAIENEEAIYQANMARQVVQDLGIEAVDAKGKLFDLLPDHKYSVAYSDLMDNVNKSANARVQRILAQDQGLVSSLNSGGPKAYNEYYTKLLTEERAKISKSIGIDLNNVGDWAKPVVELDGLQAQAITEMSGNAGTVKQLHSAQADLFNHKRNVEIAKKSNQLLNTYDKFLALYKTQVTALLPGWHARNAVSNQFQNFLSIGTDVLDPSLQKEAFRAIRKQNHSEIFFDDVTYGQIYQEAQASGLLESGYFNVDFGADSKFVQGFDEITNINDAAERGKSLGEVASDTVKGSNANPVSKDFLPARAGRVAGSFIEERDRLLHYMSLRKNGMDVDNAVDEVNHFLFDYEDLTVFEHTVMKRVVPFYTWMKKNTSLQYEQVMNQPETYRNLAKTINMIEGTVPADERVTESDRPKYADDWVQLRGGEDNLFINPAQPYQDINNLGLSPSELGSRLTPAIKAPYELATNKNLYFGSEIAGEDAPVKDRVNYILDYLEVYQSGRKLVNQRRDPDAKFRDVLNRTSGVKLGSF